jgi:hypothetical protein
LRRSKGITRGIGGALMVVLLCGVVHAAERAELARLIDSPTAGLVGKGRFAVGLRLFPDGGVLGQVQAGALKRMTIGLSFGGQQVIGQGPVDWQPRVEVVARYRAIEESAAWPALVVGYETQGYGAYGNGRYEIKSKGFYLALSKNYASSLGQFGVHAGANISREEEGGDDLTGWVGVDKSFNEDLSLLGEYELARNEGGNSDEGFLNVGARWMVAPQLKIAFFFKNVLGRGIGNPDPSRELAVVYTEEF